MILFVLPFNISCNFFPCWFFLFEYWNCFGLVLFFPHLKCLIPSFPLSLSGCYAFMAHGVTMPLFLSQTLTCLQTLEFFQRKPKPRRKILSKSPARGQGPYPRPTGVNGAFPIECSGSWIQSLHPSNPCKVFIQEWCFSFENYNLLIAEKIIDLEIHVVVIFLLLAFCKKSRGILCRDLR